MSKLDNHCTFPAAPAWAVCVYIIPDKYTGRLAQLGGRSVQFANRSVKGSSRNIKKKLRKGPLQTLLIVENAYQSAFLGTVKFRKVALTPLFAKPQSEGRKYCAVPGQTVCLTADRLWQVHRCYVMTVRVQDYYPPYMLVEHGKIHKQVRVIFFIHKLQMYLCDM